MLVKPKENEATQMEEMALKELAKQLKMPFVVLREQGIDPQWIELIEERLARKHKVIPIRREKNVLTVAICNPLDLYAIEEIKLTTQLMIYPVVSSRQEIEALIEYYYSNQQTALAAQALHQVYDQEEKKDKLLPNGHEGRIEKEPVVKMVHSLIQEGISAGASDIHIEPGRVTTRVRMRIDGQLYEKMPIESGAHESIVTRLKIMANMNIAEKRMPQDGRFEWGRERVDMRIASIPTVYGEKIVMRILGTSTEKILNKDELGMTVDNRKLLDKILYNPSGMILVTGPTGSGKSTTLYAILNERKHLAENIMTLEDPIEKKIEGINQVPINVKAGLTFATGLRALLRQDPDVMMIGEIRDTETASIAMRAAITGHLVFSTIHTNDAISTIVRLIDMGIEPYMVAASLIGIVAQRLVRRTCEHCKKCYLSTQEEMKLLGIDEPISLYKGEGCPACHATGYKGRMGIYEIVRVDSQLRQMITRGDEIGVMKAYTEKIGTLSLQRNLKQLVIEGKTTLEEYGKLVYKIDT